MRHSDWNDEPHYIPEDDCDLEECDDCGEMAPCHDLGWTIVCDNCLDEAAEFDAMERHHDHATRRAEDGYRDA